MKIPVPDHFATIKPYEPGKPLEELERELGITDSIKLASNENPLGPAPAALKAIAAAATHLHRYPDASGHVLIRKIAETLTVSPENIVLGNGSDDIIALLCRVFLQPGNEALIPKPSFLMYDIMVRCTGARPVAVPLNTALGIDLDQVAARVTPQTRMVFLCNPNNPTGTIFTQTEFDRFLNRVPETVLIVVDEAYMEFVRDPDCARGLEHITEGRSVATLRTFSKAYGLAGLRIGYGVMPADIAELLHRIRPPFNVNTLAQAGALAAIEDRAFLKKAIKTVHEGLDWLRERLTQLGVTHYPTQANFFLIEVAPDAQAVFHQMLRRGVIVRSMAAYGYPHFIRINVGLPEENRRFIKALEDILNQQQPARKPPAVG